LILLEGKRVVARLEGRAKAAEIEELVDQHLGDRVESGPRGRT
jgi:hypothetical protein